MPAAPGGTESYRARIEPVKQRHQREGQMIIEVVTQLSPEAVIEEARRFFTDEGAFHSATVVDESDTHLTLGMFRSRLAITAFPAGEEGPTTVRVSTLRRNDAVGRFLALVETADPADPARPGGETAVAGGPATDSA